VSQRKGGVAAVKLVFTEGAAGKGDRKGGNKGGFCKKGGQGGGSRAKVVKLQVV